MKKVKWILAGVAALAATVSVGGVSYDTFAQESDVSVIPDKIYVGDVAVGGMTEDEAKQAVLDNVDQKLDAQITVIAGENSINTTAKAFGVTWANQDVVDEAAKIGKIGNLIQRYKDIKDLEHEDKVYEIEYDVDRVSVRSWLEANAPELNQDAINNALKREDGAFVFVAGQEGIEVDVNQSVDRVADYFTQEWTGVEGNIALASTIVEPEGDEEQLKAIKDVLGSFSTNFSTSTKERITNIKNATGKLDGTVLYPGDELSVHDMIAPMTAENGYEQAGAYENGTTVLSYGGGVCQVSSTLYNAAIRAELEVIKRFPHSMLVSYVDPSADAAIAGDYKDFRFKNNLDNPIYIEGYTDGYNLYFNIFGKETRPSNRKVTFVSETTSETEPDIIFEASADPVGTITKTQSSHTGKTAVLWKIVTVDGEEVSREQFNSSNYSASPKKYSVGTTSSNPEAIAYINAAIATQDEATIRSTVAQWTDEAIAIRLQQQQQEQLEKEQQEQSEDGSADKKNKNENKNNQETENEESEDEPDEESEE